jgi:hypothetical protein
MKHLVSQLSYRAQHLAVQPVMAQPLPCFTKISWQIACLIGTCKTRQKAT